MDDDIERQTPPAALGLDSGEWQALFDEIVSISALMCHAPSALLTLVDGEGSRCLASTGGPPPPGLGAAEFVEVGAEPLLARDGRAIGTLSVRDRRPRRLDDRQRELLRRQANLAALAVDLPRDPRLSEALRKSEGFLERISAVAGIGGVELDLETGVGYWSDHVCRLHGVPPGYQPTLADSMRFFPPEWRPRIEAAVQNAIAGRGGWDLEVPLIPDRGDPLWVRVAGSAEFVDGKPVRLVAALADVTERVAERNALRDANERVRLATGSGGIGIYDSDLISGAMQWDDSLRALHGLEPSDAVPDVREWRRRVHPDDRPAFDAAVRAALASETPLDTEFRIVRRDGSMRHVRLSGQTTPDADGRAVRMVGAMWDVTEQRRLAADLAEQHELLRVTLASIGEAVITTDARGAITWLNPVAERLTGWPAAEAAGEPIADVFHTVEDDTAEPASAAGQTYQRLVSRDGRVYGIEASRAPIVNARGSVLGSVLVFRDVTEARRLSGEIRYRAAHDGLTGLLNRVEFEHRLRRFLQAACERDAAHAMLYIDLDDFKLVNDACGHRAGDELLGHVAQVLQQAVRAGDTLARLGGDEFAIILEHCSVLQGQRVAQQICDRMNDFRFLHDERRFRIGASIGLVPIDGRWQTSAAILQAADAACYAAKEGGRNRVHTWIETDRAIHARHAEMQWTMRIERALDDDLFVLFAQRIEPRAARTGGAHAEVLLRMREHDGSLIPPGAFLPAAERYHLAGRIDRCVIGKAIAWLERAPEDAIAMLAVNLSGQSVGDPAFHRWAYERLAAAGSRICSQLCFEVTETAAITNLAGAITFIEHVRAAGVRMALYDFGAGASSFGYLKSMPVDLLKIDGQFIADIVSDRVDALTVACFADIARVMGIQTVAEHVDAPEILTRLDVIGIDYAQGFHVHRPAAIDELLPVADRRGPGKG